MTHAYVLPKVTADTLFDNGPCVPYHLQAAPAQHQYAFARVHPANEKKGGAFVRTFQQVCGCGGAAAGCVGRSAPVSHTHTHINAHNSVCVGQMPQMTRAAPCRTVPAHLRERAVGCGTTEYTHTSGCHMCGTDPCLLMHVLWRLHTESGCTGTLNASIAFLDPIVVERLLQPRVSVLGLQQ